MRQVLSTSFPANVISDIKKRAKEKNVSVSSYFLHLYEIEKEMISEGDLLERAEQAKENYKKGKVMKINSLADLMD